jgi:hypothetical protein
MAIINGVGRVGIRNYVSPIPQASTLINGLIHAWNANGNANDSIGGLNGTLVNGALADATPKIGSGAFYFDGINDRITLADNSLNLTTDFTVSFWCKGGVGSNKTIIHNKYFANDANTSGWSIIYDGTGISFDITTAGVSTADIRHLLPNWNHVVVKYTRGVKMEIFLNGVLNATKNTTLTPTYSYTPIKTSIGTWNSVYMINGGPTLYPGTGLLDALNIWNRALTSAEITELYGLTTELQAPTPTYPIITAGLNWYFDVSNPLCYSGSGTSITDLSGNGNTGTLVNGVGYSTSNGGVLTLDGVNDYINVPHSTSLVKTNIGALFLYVKLNSSGNAIPIGKGDILYDRSAYGMYVYNGYECVEIASATSSVNAYTYPVVTGVWKQLGMVWNGTTIKKYINGVEVHSNTQTVNVNDIGEPMRIGARSNTGNVNANMSFGEVYLYDTLTPTQITANFNATKTRYGL